MNDVVPERDDEEPSVRDGRVRCRAAFEGTSGGDLPPLLCLDLDPFCPLDLYRLDPFDPDFVLVLAYDFGELVPQDGVELFLDPNHLRTWSFFDLINRMIFQEKLGGFIESCFNLHLREIVTSAFPAIIKESALGDFWQIRFLFLGLFTFQPCTINASRVEAR